jgi:tetratricopeptide (TPR) repeat protein
MRAFIVLSVLWGVLLLPTSALRAQESGEYKTTIQQAVQEFDAGNWLEARVLFQRAHALSPNARTWRSLGITAYELRRYVDAIAELEAALADHRKPLAEKARVEVAELLARAREFVAVYKLSVQPEGAQVLVDGEPVALRDGQLFLDPGSHTVIVRAPGYEEARKDLRIDEPGRDELSIELRVAGQDTESAVELGASAPQQAQPSSAPAQPETRRRLWTWVLGGTAVAAGAAGVGLGLAARGKHEDFLACDTDCSALKSKGQSLQLGANIAYGAAGALAIGAVVSWFVEGKREQPARLTAYVHTHGLGLQGAF